METSVNNKCRAFTSLEQSKKLADILPIESADMYHFIDDIDELHKVGFGYIKITADYYLKAKLEYIPCWSLAALLGVLPRKVELEDTAYTIGVSLDSINYSNVNNGDLLLEVKVKDNLVDACYEVIIKLYELKML